MSHLPICSLQISLLLVQSQWSQCVFGNIWRLFWLPGFGEVVREEEWYRHLVNRDQGSYLPSYSAGNSPPTLLLLQNKELSSSHMLVLRNPLLATPDYWKVTNCALHMQCCHLPNIFFANSFSCFWTPRAPCLFKKPLLTPIVSYGKTCPPFCPRHRLSLNKL